ncbi:hypothetical protein J1N35_039968 [Gossypium stocksii]|uniref:RING-type E3 ubiquitin transferase n=1 Tax=Gossypium stocksii TaxID=47602 RepID=A0A9D3UCZ7_9ROSI|nr:hypothetical protein J1N35_039968 [Gossypium stocksii]
MTTSITSTLFSQDLYPRKFLLHSSLHPIESPAISPAQHNNSPINDNFHSNAAIILLVLICTIISSLGLFCMVKCSIRGSSSVASESGVNPSAKLANKGVERKALNSFPTIKYATELKLTSLDTACAICLSEFAAEERLRILPKCNHGFHTQCIDTWLSSHSSCPTCRHCLIETDQKTDNCSPIGSLEQPLPVQESIVNVNVEEN